MLVVVAVMKAKAGMEQEMEKALREIISKVEAEKALSPTPFIGRKKSRESFSCMRSIEIRRR
jgi:hypothetical protein